MRKFVDLLRCAERAELKVMLVSCVFISCAEWWFVCVMGNLQAPLYIIVIVDRESNEMAVKKIMNAWRCIGDMHLSACVYSVYCVRVVKIPYLVFINMQRP